MSSIFNLKFAIFNTFTSSAGSALPIKFLQIANLKLTGRGRRPRQVRLEGHDCNRNLGSRRRCAGEFAGLAVDGEQY
jgi:hypothetical protein